MRLVLYKKSISWFIKAFISWHVAACAETRGRLKRQRPSKLADPRAGRFCVPTSSRENREMDIHLESKSIRYAYCRDFLSQLLEIK